MKFYTSGGQIRAMKKPTFDLGSLEQAQKGQGIFKDQSFLVIMEKPGKSRDDVSDLSISSEVYNQHAFRRNSENFFQSTRLHSPITFILLFSFKSIIFNSPIRNKFGFEFKFFYKFKFKIFPLESFRIFKIDFKP